VADQHRSFPNQYDQNLASSGLQVHEFGFNAGYVRLTNDGAGAAFLTFNSTVGSTGGYQLSSGETLDWRNVGAPAWGVVVVATSTANVVRVGAWG
jgi:hypothetical protein